MAKYIVEIRNPENDSDRRLIEWSTIVDAPVTYGMSHSEFVDYYLVEYGVGSAANLLGRLQRVRANGTSAHGDASWEDTIAVNRAGPGESEATAADIWRMCVSEAPTSGPTSWPSDVAAVRRFVEDWTGGRSVARVDPHT